MASTYDFEDSLRIHDEAFSNWWGGCLLDYGELGGSSKPSFPILRVFAGVQRAFAAVLDLLVSSGFVAGADADAMRALASDEQDLTLLPLPFLTMQRGFPRIDPVLWTPGDIRKGRINPKSGEWENYPTPMHAFTEYTAQLWCRTKSTEAYVTEWILSQVGRHAGLSISETLVPVAHPAPVGTINQQLRFDSGSDASELEGETPRYIRVDYTFTMRTWLWRKATLVPVVDALLETVEQDVTQSSPDVLESTVPVQSWNIFQPYTTEVTSSQWPREGVTSRVDVRRSGFRVTVQQPGDLVHLFEAVLRQNRSGLILVSISGRLRVLAPIRLRVSSADYYASDARTSEYVADLQRYPKEGRYHRYCLLYGRVAHVGLEAVGLATGELDVGRLDIRYQLPELDAISPGAQGATEATWVGLGGRSYLVAARWSAAVSGDVVYLDNDAVSPTFTQSFEVKAGRTNVVFVGVPASGTLRLRFPSSVVLASLFALPYAGGYIGNDLIEE